MLAYCQETGARIAMVLFGCFLLTVAVMGFWHDGWSSLSLMRGSFAVCVGVAAIFTAAASRWVLADAPSNNPC
jgi:hypothetical protein